MTTEITTPQTSSLRTSIDWSPLIERFVASQDVKDSSRKLYARTLRLFFAWVEKTGRNLNELRREDILSYKDYLLSGGLSSLTAGSYLTSLRKFYEWTEGETIYPNIAKSVKTPHRKQTFRKQHLGEDASRDLLHYFEEKSLRDFAIVNLALRTGLRTIEIVRANIGDITFKAGKRVLLVWGKGRDERDNFVLLTEKSWEPIKAYLETRKGAKAGDPLFVSDSRQNKGERLTTRTISGICKEGLRAIGLDGREFTAHSLRHTCAVAILTHGGSLTDAQSVLRHTSPTTTQIYTKSIEEELRLQNSPESLLDKAF